jgi:hypothetical protein
MVSYAIMMVPFGKKNIWQHQGTSINFRQMKNTAKERVIRSSDKLSC